MRNTFLLLFIFLFAACSSFDSNKLNRELIQGKWEQAEIVTIAGGNVSVEKTEENTFLTFSADSCIEEMKDVGTTHIYKYDIRDYYLSLKEEGDVDSYLTINKLTKDSLLLSAEDRILKYTRKTE